MRVYELAEVRAPVPGGDAEPHRVHGAHAHQPVRVIGDGAQVSLVHLVRHHHVLARLEDLLLGERHLHQADLRALEEAADVLAQPEDRPAPVGLRITADALEDRDAVMERVRQDVHLRIGPGNELAVHPDELGLLELLDFLRGHDSPRRLSVGPLSTPAPGKSRYGFIKL